MKQMMVEMWRDLGSKRGFCFTVVSLLYWTSQRAAVASCFFFQSAQASLMSRDSPVTVCGSVVKGKVSAGRYRTGRWRKSCKLKQIHIFSWYNPIASIFTALHKYATCWIQSVQTTYFWSLEKSSPGRSRMVRSAWLLQRTGMGQSISKVDAADGARGN